MTQSIPADPTKGVASHYLLTEPEVVRIETFQYKDRAGVTVAGYDSLGRFILAGQFKKGRNQFVVIQLPVGSWRVESSHDGKKYDELTVLDSKLLVSGKPSQAINLLMGGQAFPAAWGRYTLLQMNAKKG